MSGREDPAANEPGPQSGLDQELTDPRFAREVMKLLGRRSRELWAEKARRLGRLVAMIRRRKGFTRADIAIGPRITRRWLYLLEHQLLEFEDLYREQVEALGKALGVPAVWLAESCGFSLLDCPPLPSVMVLAVGATAGQFLRGQHERGLMIAAHPAFLELADERYAGPVDYIHDDRVHLTNGERISFAAYVEGYDLLLLTADLTENDSYRWPLLELLQHVSQYEHQSPLRAALLLFRPVKGDPIMTLRDEGQALGYRDVPLRESLAEYLDILIAVNADKLAALMGALSPNEEGKLAGQEFARILGDLLVALQNPEMVKLLRQLRGSRPAAVGVADERSVGVAGGTGLSPSVLVQKALRRRTTDVGFTADHSVVLVTLRTGPLSLDEVNETETAVKELFAQRTGIYLVPTEPYPGEGQRTSVFSLEVRQS